MRPMEAIDQEAYARKFSQVLPHLNEKQRRIYLGSEAEALGHGGTSLVSKLSGLSRPTIIEGRKELESEPVPDDADTGRVRAHGGGRKKKTEEHPGLLLALEKMMEPVTRGHPESVLKWTCLSTRSLAKRLLAEGHDVSYKLVGRLLDELGFSLQSNAKRLEGGSHEDRNEQFLYINNRAESFIASNFPVISVDTKKKELLGNYKNAGKEYRLEKDPRPVKVHDFGKVRASPYGVYDISRNEGFVNVGTSSDTSEFAVQSIRQWWLHMGKEQYPQATELLITADGGGSNGSRARLWKTELQKFATESGLEITVCHFPPGTSKWNKIEHRLFSYISMNWKGIPLVDIETVVELIGAVTTEKGLKVVSRKEPNVYQKGIVVSDEELGKVKLKRHEFHGEWNYTISP